MSQPQSAVVAERIAFDDLDAAIDYCYEQGWTDGLPVVPPSEARVQQLIDYVGRDPMEVLGVVPPRQGVATLEAVATNAVMAGCTPELFPVVLAALDAVLDPILNLNGVQATTHICAPLVIVSGPAVQELGFNSKDGVFGGGSRANASVGRALRLVMWNIGGGRPGEIDKSTFGHPGKYAYCIAEDADANPWEPMHVEYGVAASASAVTVFACEAPHSISDHVNTTTEGVLTSVSDAMATIGNNNMYMGGQTLLVIGPEHAEIIRRDGWSRAQVREFVHEQARRPVGDLAKGGFGVGRGRSSWPASVDPEDEKSMVPVTPTPEDILVTVAGGSGRFSACCPGWGDLGGFAVTREISFPG